MFFDPTGNDQVGDAGHRSLSGLGAQAEARAAGSPRAQASADVVGRASPRWQNPRPGQTPEDENEALSFRRAQNTGQALNDVMRNGGLPLGSTAMSGAGPAPGPVDQDLPRQRRADVDIAVTRYQEVPTPGPAPGPGPGPGPAPGPGPVPVPYPSGPTPPPGQLPSLGWDTTMSAQYAGRAGGRVSGTVGVTGGVGYTIEEPIWRYDFGAVEGRGLRILLGLYKISMDVAAANPIGFVRDAAGLIGGVEEIVGVELTDPIVDFVIPAPESA